MTWGIKISKPTFNVRTCSNDQLIMSSEFDMLKTKTSGSTSGTGDITIAHGQSYTPICFVAKKLGTNDYGLIGQTSFSVSSANLTINAGLSTEYFRYYIFYEQLVV
jgi:hypothetical protein